MTIWSLASSNRRILGRRRRPEFLGWPSLPSVNFAMDARLSRNGRLIRSARSSDGCARSRGRIHRRRRHSRLLRITSIGRRVHHRRWAHIWGALRWVRRCSGRFWSAGRRRLRLTHWRCLTGWCSGRRRQWGRVSRRTVLILHWRIRRRWIVLSVWRRWIWLRTARAHIIRRVFWTNRLTIRAVQREIHLLVGAIVHLIQGHKGSCVCSDRRKHAFLTKSDAIAAASFRRFEARAPYLTGALVGICQPIDCLTLRFLQYLQAIAVRCLGACCGAWPGGYGGGGAPGGY
jgi:hypothetical protein